MRKEDARGSDRGCESPLKTRVTPEHKQRAIHKRREKPRKTACDSFCIGNSNRSSCGNNNSCGNSNNSCGSSSSCGSSNACGARCLEDEGRGGDRDRRPPRPDFPNFTPVDDPAFSRRNDGRCETCGCEQNS